MVALADRYGIVLSDIDRGRISLAATYTHWAKRAFLYYVRLRIAVASGARREIADA
jgi:hypothetical protein